MRIEVTVSLQLDVPPNTDLDRVSVDHSGDGLCFELPPKSARRDEDDETDAWPRADLSDIVGYEMKSVTVVVPDEIQHAVFEVLGKAVPDEDILAALALTEKAKTGELFRQLGSLERQFPDVPSRSPETVKDVDTLRIALAARTVDKK